MKKLALITFLSLFVFNFVFGQSQEAADEKFDKFLASILDTVYNSRLEYEKQDKEIIKKYGIESKEAKAHWNITIPQKDSINLIIVKQILDERGWVGADVVGENGNRVLYFVIRGADFKTQEKYLPMLREAVSKGNAIAKDLALLEDRTALRKREKQIYGTQVSYDIERGERYVLPLLDPDNVDKRRAEVGLETIQEYISKWNMTWDVEEYKKRLPEYESKEHWISI